MSSLNGHQKRRPVSEDVLRREDFTEERIEQIRR